MTDNIYFKRPNEFKAIQFTGGEENGKLIIEWLYQHVPGSRGATSWQKHSPATIDGQEWIAIGRRTIKPGMWLTVDSHHEDFTVFTEEEFQKLFVLTQEFTEESFHVEASEQIVPNTDGFRGDLQALINRYSLESDTGTPDFILAEFLFGSLYNLTNFVHERAKWRGESLELPARLKLMMNSQYGKDEELTEISNGVIDSVPEGIKDVEYDEVAASKVIEIIVEHIPTMSIRKATDLVKAFKHAGLLV